MIIRYEEQIEKVGGVFMDVFPERKKEHIQIMNKHKTKLLSDRTPPVPSV